MKVLVIGAGFAGAVVARELAEVGHIVTVIDKRNHIAGNAHDFINEYGIRVHTYGPHIFHTSNEEVVNWLSQFTDWLPYKHIAKAQLADGQYVPLPVNTDTLKVVPKENVIETFFRPYSEKMWGMKLEELDPSIISRVPTKDSDDPYYFPNDKFQFMPANGYTAIFENMLSHDNISVELEIDYLQMDLTQFDHVFNSAAIDVHFGQQFGELPYRSLRFHTSTVPMPKLLPTPVVNFTHKEKFTRITEWQQFPGHGYNAAFTTITAEEPCDYKDNNFERYYPVKTVDNRYRDLYKQYADLVDAEHMTFIGRLGNYAYLDMHQAISSSLAVAKKFK